MHILTDRSSRLFYRSIITLENKNKFKEINWLLQYSPRNQQKTYGFLIISWGIEVIQFI